MKPRVAAPDPRCLIPEVFGPGADSLEMLPTTMHRSRGLIGPCGYACLAGGSFVILLMFHPVFWLAARDRFLPKRIRSSEVGPPFLKPCACFAGFFACARRAAIALLSFSAISGSLCSGRADRDCTNISLPDQAIWRQGRIKTTGPTYRCPAPLNHPATNTDGVNNRLA